MAKLTLEEKTLQELRQAHEQDLEQWWQDRFGHAFDSLTQSEARYLARSPDADTIRDRIAAAEQAGDGGSESKTPVADVSARRRAGCDLETTAPKVGPSAFSAPAAATIGSRQNDAKEINDEGLPYPCESPRANLRAARRLIEGCGYWRRKEELEDTEEAAKGW